MSPQPTIETRKSRAVPTVKVLSYIALALFYVVFLDAPTGITVPWGDYLVYFTPIIITDVSALVAFGYCRSNDHAISWGYAALCVGVLLGVAYLTLFVLRLRWNDI